MHSYVCVQVSACAEAPAANMAGERALASVPAEVRLEIGVLRKGTRAGGVGAGLSGEFLASVVLVGCE